MKRLLILVAVPAALLAGCSGGNASPTAGPATTVVPSPADTGPTGPAGPTGATRPTGPTADPSPSDAVTGPATVGTAVARCHSQDLALKLGGGDGAAGTSRENLIFTNRSGRKCTLSGYPGVSWVTGDNGTQVNDPFTREKDTRRTITLAPGGVAHSVLQQHRTGNFDPAECKPVKVRGFRIYPPDETASIFVAQSQDACSIKGVNLGQVFPIQSGTGGVA